MILGHSIAYRTLYPDEHFSEEPQVIHCHNRFHYGDHIFNLKFFKAHASLLKSKHITIRYYYDTSYITSPKELLHYVDPEVVSLHSLYDAPSYSHELWMGHCFDICHYQFDSYFHRHYNKLKNMFSLHEPSVCTDFFMNEPYLEDNYQSLPYEYKDVDVLVINCKPFSGQTNVTIEQFTPLVYELTKTLKVVTTEKINGVLCTRDKGLSLQDIGAISTRAKYIVSVNSGPTVPCYNHLAKASVRHWLLFDNDKTFETPTITCLNYFPSVEQCKSILKL